jgi:hypothetical protein
MKMVTIGNKQFKNASDAKIFVKEIFGSYIPGETISPPDTIFFIELLRLHPDGGISKIGCGAKRMFIRKNKYGGNTLWLERNDGSETDFSIYKPLDRKTTRIKLTRNEIDFRKACRTAIVDDKKLLKSKTNSFGDAHHTTEFEVLVKNFIKLYAIDIEKVLFEGHNDGDCEISFVDKTLEKTWIEYHRTNVSWIVLSKDEHKTKHKKPI